MASKTGLGSSVLWGLTPATNLLTFLDDETLMEADSGERAINILFVGGADCRHLLKLLEEHLNFRTRELKINVFIIENAIDMYARQLLLLTFASVPLDKIGLYEKTKQFLEVFGNTKVRVRTRKTLVKLAGKLERMITDDEYFANKLPFVSISDLKFVERDALVEVFKYWSENCDDRKENLEEKWDKRLRLYLGTRYDSRVRIFDWDYHMRLVERGGKIVSPAEYKLWRGSGMAFVDDDSEYSQPNVTLLSVSGNSGRPNAKSSAFLGEIITGPFIAHGIECDDKAMFEKSNDRYRHTSRDIAVYNMERIFLALDSVKEFPPVTKEVGGGEGRGQAERKPFLSDIISVTFLPLESAKYLHLKKEFQGKFDLVYFGSTAAQALTPEVGHVFGPKSIVIVEGVRYMLELRKEHIQAYKDKVEELARNAKLYKLSGDSENFGSDFLCYTVVPPAKDPSQGVFTSQCPVDSAEGV